MSPVTTTTTETPTPDQKIDALLERYLLLLNEYTALRTSLHALQKNLFQNLARANFSPADRGVAYYGKDYYDERMQASRRLCVVVASPGQSQQHAPVVLKCEAVAPPSQSSSQGSKQEEEKGGERGGNSEEEEVGGGEAKTQRDGEASEKDGENDGERDDGERTETKKKAPNRDPLRWFGILTPLALRQAQGLAVTAVEDIIPRLASVSLEMAEVELEVRRARKKRAKAEREEGKKAQREEEGKLEELGEEVGKLDVNDGEREEGMVIGEGL